MGTFHEMSLLMRLVVQWLLCRYRLLSLVSLEGFRLVLISMVEAFII